MLNFKLTTEIAKDFLHFVKMAKFRRIWSYWGTAKCERPEKQVHHLSVNFEKYFSC